MVRVVKWPLLGCGACRKSGYMGIWGNVGMWDMRKWGRRDVEMCGMWACGISGYMAQVGMSGCGDGGDVRMWDVGCGDVGMWWCGDVVMW